MRDELDRSTQKGDEAARQAAILKAKDLTAKIANEVMTLYKNGKIDFYDIDKIMIALKELFTHLNKRYEVNEKLNTEVNNMVRTFITDDMRKILEQLDKLKKEEKRKAVDLAAEMLLDGEPIEKIIKYTKLTQTEIQEIQKTS